MVGLFNVHLMIYDPFKHIIECHPLVGGVLVDQGNHIVVHWCVLLIKRSINMQSVHFLDPKAFTC
jgi:hypothetical protein